MFVSCDVAGVSGLVAHEVPDGLDLLDHGSGSRPAAAGFDRRRCPSCAAPRAAAAAQTCARLALSTPRRPASAAPQAAWPLEAARQAQLQAQRSPRLGLAVCPSGRLGQRRGGDLCGVRQTRQCRAQREACIGRYSSTPRQLGDII
ncbi:unnamed protein product [Prorocentrum cordatum]|uniref:Uncharacterized protein n=1 Tax=Prorocentrum cordatum TaxID=2364126 RepID=A0ABN9T3L2_9DINO|nr:unnamed protein product [Polarella glacialis]